MRPYYETLAILSLIVLVSCCVLPSLVRRGCQGSAGKQSETIAWRQLDPRVKKASGAVGGAAAAAKGGGGAASAPLTAPVAASTAGGAVVDAATGAVKSTLRVVGIGPKGAAASSQHLV